MSKGVSRVLRDRAGDLILGPGARTVFVNKLVVSVIGDRIAPHSSGAHLSATMIESSKSVFAAGKTVVRDGDKASCGDVATGSTDVFAG
jgi:uncharacterized Zn-binding protein involved in type VI secretion